MSVVLGIDIGGTFTDVIAIDGTTGDVRAAKAPTDPERPVAGISASLEKLALDIADVALIVHGSTTCTNALLEGKQARTGFIGTRGFSDEFDIQRMVRRWSTTPWSAIYDLQQQKPPPLVSRSLRREVRERIVHPGDVVEPLDVEGLLVAADELVREGVEALGICFLWSGANPVHERQARNLIQGRHPSLCVSASCDVAPVVREYERMVTSVVNASLMPVHSRYLAEVEQQLRDEGFDGDLFLMQSSGGVARPSSLGDRPVLTLNSGPVGGAVATAALARRLRRRAVIACDIGGTSTDTTVVLDYDVPMREELEVAYYPVRIPTADIRSIGAGGGSVVSIDAGGALRVGPRSMGARPGPACYGRGGTTPTLTDANVALGRIAVDTLSAGGVAISPQAALDALAPVAEQLELELPAAAHAVVTVAVANVAHALRLQTVDRGRDPRDFALVAFGGAGGLHATLIAEAASIAEVIVPPAPGVFSSLGMVLADHGTFVQASFLSPAADVAAAELEARFVALEDEARRILGQLAPDAAAKRWAALRYTMQEWELRVAVERGVSIPEIVATFHAAHEARHGFAREDMPVEFVTLFVDLFARSPNGYRSAAAPSDSAPIRDEPRRVYVDPVLGTVEIAVYDRLALQPGDTVDGPCLLEEPTATTYVQPHWTAQIDTFGNLVARRAA